MNYLISILIRNEPYTHLYQYHQNLIVYFSLCWLAHISHISPIFQSYSLIFLSYIYVENNLFCQLFYTLFLDSINIYTVSFFLILQSSIILFLLQLGYNNKQDRGMQKQIIKPYFHYSFKSQAIVIDTQYTFEGQYLAVCTSNASILVYKSPIQQTLIEEHFQNPIAQFNNSNKNNCFLKLAWSFYDAFVLAAMSINKEISYFQFDKTTLKLQKSTKCQSIPIFGSFMPTFQLCILSVGFSDGAIGLFNQNLQQLFLVEAHAQSVNWLTWERRLGTSGRNLWIAQNFPAYVNVQNLQKAPIMASGSSDKYIKIWSVKNNKLVQIHSFKAHEKEIRQVMWRPNYFNNSKIKSIVSCSQDGFVKFWQISEGPNKLLQKMKSSTNFNTPVYRAEYNLVGSMIAISYYGGEEGKVQTKAYIDKEGVLGEEIPILQ